MTTLYDIPRRIENGHTESTALEKTSLTMTYYQQSAPPGQNENPPSPTGMVQEYGDATAPVQIPDTIESEESASVEYRNAAFGQEESEARVLADGEDNEDLLAMSMFNGGSS